MIEPHITTFTGRKVNPLALRVEDIDIRDIAHHLAILTRWVGASRYPLNIAAHSVFVSRVVERLHPEVALEALLHDAPEAYIGDVSKWVKMQPEMAAFREAEHLAWLVICEALKLQPAAIDLPVVKYADNLLVRYEATQALHVDVHLFAQPTHPRPTEAEVKIMRNVGWSAKDWRFSERMFLARFGVLAAERPEVVVSLG